MDLDHEDLHDITLESQDLCDITLESAEIEDTSECELLDFTIDSNEDQLDLLAISNDHDCEGDNCPLPLSLTDDSANSSHSTVSSLYISTAIDTASACSGNSKGNI